MRGRNRLVRITSALLIFGCLLTVLRADLAGQLAGRWVMTDESVALGDEKNPAGFVISRVVPADSGWSDGSFSLTWAGEAVAARGYFSQGTGRIWVTTRRFIDGRSQQVEYRGTLKEDGTVRWAGTASTTNATPRTAWSFVATRD